MASMQAMHSDAFMPHSCLIPFVLQLYTGSPTYSISQKEIYILSWGTIFDIQTS